MRINKIYNVDLFTSAANDKYNKHIKTQSKRALEIIKSKVEWERIIISIEEVIEKLKENYSYCYI